MLILCKFMLIASQNDWHWSELIFNRYAASKLSTYEIRSEHTVLKQSTSVHLGALYLYWNGCIALFNFYLCK